MESTPCPSRTTRISRTTSVSRGALWSLPPGFTSALTSAISRRMELVPQSTAATRVIWTPPRRRRRWRRGRRRGVAGGIICRAGLADGCGPAHDLRQALRSVAAEVTGRDLSPGVPGAVAVAAVGRPPFGDSGDRLVAERVHARTGGQRVAHEDVQALDAGRHSAGRNAVDFRNGTDPGPGADRGTGGQIGLVGGAVTPRQERIVLEPAVHLVHQPGGLQPRHRGRDHRMGEVKRGGERRTVAQPR